MRASRPSLTAAKIARGIALVSVDPRVRELLPRGCVETNEQLLLETRLAKPWMFRLYRKPWFQRYVHWVGRHTVAGQMMTLPVRKRFMDDEVRSAIERGARQLLVVGAGFDTLALRIANQYPDVVCFEVDHPATQRPKRRAVEALELARPNLHLVSVDLAERSLPEALARLEGFRKDALSVTVVEGVLMYLDESDVIAFLEGLRASVAPGSTLLFTHLRTDESGRLYTGKNTGLMRASLALLGEPLQWGIGRDELGDFLKRRGFRWEQSPTPEELRRRYLEPVGLGEEIVGDFELMAVAVAS
jgi:methyltransferase (TIGR00027 family)